MRIVAAALTMLIALAAAVPAGASTVMIMVDPISLERTVHVLERSGPYRVLLCTAPPSIAGCRDITQRRR